MLSAVPEDHRKLVTNHDSFSYFGASFDFEILDTILSGGSTLAQPGTAHLAELVDQIRAEGVTAIFTETTADDGLPNTVAAELRSSPAGGGMYTGPGPRDRDAGQTSKWLVTNLGSLPSDHLPDFRRKGPVRMPFPNRSARRRKQRRPDPAPNSVPTRPTAGLVSGTPSIPKRRAAPSNPSLKRSLRPSPRIRAFPP